MRPRTAPLISLVTALALALAGCTSSIGAYAQSGGDRPGETAAQLMVSGELVSPQLIDELSELSGITLSAAAPGEGDVELGQVQEPGVPYGVDFVCLIAQQSWFAANRLGTPASAGEAAPYLALSDPEDIPQVAWWLAGNAGLDQVRLEQNLKALVAAGASLPWYSTDANAKSGAEVGRVIVESALYPVRNANNLGTGSEWVAVPNTCVEYTVFAQNSGTNEEANDFIDFLLTPTAQQLLAQTGSNYPLARTEQLPEPVENLAPYPQHAETLTPTELEEAQAMLLRIVESQGHGAQSGP